MATTQTRTSGIENDLTVDVRDHSYPDGPAHVLVELNPAGGGTYMAILAAGEAGRYSFDFRVSSQGIEITKAYIEGMRERTSELPGWDLVDCVREEIEQRFGV